MSNKKLDLKQLVDATATIGDMTLLGVGPMSTNVTYACMDLGKSHNAPLMFIASRNQIDSKEFGGGYVNGWDQHDLVDNLSHIADEIQYYDYYVCRDHGGPWQRDEERKKQLPLEEAMAIAKKSFQADIDAGFDMIMVDPTKDPHTPGKTVPIDFVIDKTVELIQFCEQYRASIHSKPIYYEVGTEETNGGLTTAKEYAYFLEQLKIRLAASKLPMPIFAVGQTGTLVKSTTQAGHFNIATALELSNVTAQYHVCLKEHNADYLEKVDLLSHIPAKVGSINVAPQFGTEETRAYLILDKLEKKFANFYGYQISNIREVLLDHAIQTRRWEKWAKPQQTTLSNQEIKQDALLSQEILEIAGHYTLNEEPVKDTITTLYANLNQLKIDGQTFVREHIKSSIRPYFECLNLSDCLSKIKDL